MTNLLMCHNYSYEQTFIGRCLNEDGFAMQWVGMVGLGHIYNSKCAIAMTYIMEAVNSGKKPEFLEVSQKMDDPWLLECMEQYSATIEGYRLYLHLEKYRRVREFAKIAIVTSKGLPDDEEILGLAVDKMVSLVGNCGDEKDEFSMKELAEKSVERWEKNQNDRRIYHFDIPKLREYMRLKPGNLLYIVAPPKTGKTWLMCSMAASLCYRHLKTYFVSCEMHPEDLYSRVGSYVSGVDLTAFDSGETINTRHLATYSECINKLTAMPLTIVKAIGINFSKLHAKIRSVAMRGFEVIMIDYLQRIHKPDAKDLRIATNQISGMLADCAKKYNILIICASQAGRAANKEKVTEIYHAKESGAIEADADAILTLNNSTDYTKVRPGDELELTMKLAQRNGTGGVFKLGFNPALGRYTEPGGDSEGF